MPPISQAAYAKHRGISREAVSKAIAAGRLPTSTVVVDGRAQILDVDLADQEWAENTRPASTGARGAAGLADLPDLAKSNIMLMAAKARREIALADMAELDLDERRGELVAAAPVRAEVESRYAIVRTKLLAVPSGLGQRLPEFAERVVPIAEELIREALEELAGRGAGGAANPDQGDDAG